MSDNERTIFDMIINPTYDETMSLYEASRKHGEQMLSESGYAIGDTVYMNGQIEATIDRASTMGLLDTLVVCVVMDGNLASEYLGVLQYAGKPKVIVQCSVHDFTKERLSKDDQFRYDWFKKRRVYRPSNWREIPLERLT